MAEGSQPRKRNLAGEAFKKNYDALRDALAQSDLASVLATELHSETIIAVHTRDAILACSDSSRVFQLLQAVECTIESDHRRLRKFVRVLKKQPDLKPIAKQLRQCYSDLVSEARLPESSSSGSDTDSTDQPQPQDDRPNMMKLLSFPSRDGSTINIPRQIGAEYIIFGTHLLEDKRQARVTAIANENNNQASAINMALLRVWLQGSGTKPVTWDTLARVLRSVPLDHLAEEIEWHCKAVPVRSAPSHYEVSTSLLSSYALPSWGDIPFFSPSTPSQDDPRDLSRLRHPSISPMETLGHLLNSPIPATSMEKYSVPAGWSPIGRPGSLASRCDSFLHSKSCSPEHAYGPRCKDPFGRKVQHKLECLLESGSKERTELLNELSVRKKQLVQEGSRAIELFKEKEELKSRLTIAEDTVTWLLDKLEKQTDLIPVQKQYRELKSYCADVELLANLKSELESLQKEKETLENQCRSLKWEVKMRKIAASEGIQRRASDPGIYSTAEIRKGCSQDKNASTIKTETSMTTTTTDTSPPQKTISIPDEKVSLVSWFQGYKKDVDSCETFSQEISSKVQNLRSRLKQYSETYQKKSTRV